MRQDIRVERCPSCGAPYNVTRLAPGATFRCRRCQAVVHVAGELPVPSRPSRGALAVAALLLGAAVLTRVLPWPPGLEPDLILLAATALAFATLAVVPSPPAFAVTGGLLLLLVLRAEGAESAVALGAPEPGFAFARIALGAGCFALASRGGAARGAARCLAIGGAFGLLASHVTTAAVATDAVAEVVARARAVADWWTEVVWREGPQAPGTSPWSGVIPWTLTGLAGALGLLAALLPPRRTGPVVRFLARVGFATLVAAALAPHLARAWTVRDDLLGSEGWATAQRAAADLLLRGGFATWFAGAVLLGHAAWAHGSRSGVAPARTRTQGWHATAAALAAAALLLLENPTTGEVATRWPWDASVLPGLGPAAGFAVLLGGLAAASALFATIPFLRRGGALPAVAAGLALMAADTGVGEHGVPRAALPVLASVAAGIVWARRGARWGAPARAVSALAALGVLAILLWPRSGTEIATARHVGPWDCALLRWAAALPDALGGGALGRAFLEPAAVVVPVTAAGAVAGLVAAAAWPLRPVAWLAAGLAVVAALYPAGHAFATAASAASAGGAVEAGCRAAAHALRLLPAPAVLAALAASADVAGGETEDSGQPSNGG